MSFAHFSSRQSAVEELSRAFDEIDVNIDKAIDRFVNCVLDATFCIKGVPRFDSEFKTPKETCRKLFVL